MELEEYRKEKKFSYEQLAEFLELRRGTVYNICNGVGCLKLATAHRILVKTHGRVSYEDLLTAQEAC